MKWYEVTQKIQSIMASGKGYTIQELAEKTGLSEDAVRGFIGLLNVEKNQGYYTLITTKRLTNRQTVLLALETAKRFEEVERLSQAEILDRAVALNPHFSSDQLGSILSQLSSSGQIVRVGYKRNYLYLTDLPKSKVRARRVATQESKANGILQSALDVATYVETSEARIRELEETVQRLTTKLSRYERLAKELTE